MKKEIEIREPKENELDEMFRLRWEIMRKPYGLAEGSEKDDKDKDAICVIAIDKNNKKVVGSCRLNVWDKVFRIGIMSVANVHEKYRRMGIADRMNLFF